jgi:hypothetical protein
LFHIELALVVKFPFDRQEPFVEIRQLFEYHDCPQVEAIFDRGVAADRGIGFFDGTCNGALCLDPRAVGDLDMPCDAYLSANLAIFADFGRPGDTGLGSDGGIFADFYIMGNMYEVVKFDPFSYDRTAQACPVNGTVGPDFDIVLDYHVAQLRDFPVAAVFLWGKSETIRTDHGISMQDAV